MGSGFKYISYIHPYRAVVYPVFISLYRAYEIKFIIVKNSKIINLYFQVENMLIIYGTKDISLTLTSSYHQLRRLKRFQDFPWRI